jgi:hypothetical protein
MVLGKWKEDTKAFSIRTKYRKLCKCGHSLVMYPFEKLDYKVCKWCGRRVYKNEQTRFKYILKKYLKEDK